MDGDSCEIDEFFNDLADNYQASAAGLFRLIEQIVERGIDVLSIHQPGIET